MDIISANVLFFAGVFQIVQWAIVLTNLYEKKYKTKKEFFLKMTPGYYIVLMIRFFWKIFENFMLLQ